MFMGMRRLMSCLMGFIGVRRLKLKKAKKISLGSILEEQVSRRPDKALLIFEDKHITYRNFNETANRFAHLWLDLNFKKGDTVALLMANRPEYLVIHAGLAKIGVVIALVNTHICGKMLARALNTAEARTLIVGHEFKDKIQEMAAEIKLTEPGKIFLEKEGCEFAVPDDMIDLAPLLQIQSQENIDMNPPITTKDILEYIYTSGTTGMPKVTALTQHKWLQVGYGAGGMCLRAIPEDVLYCCLPLYHNSAINLAWSTTLMHGGTFAISRKFSATHFWQDIRRYKATLSVYVGELCRYLNNQPRLPNDADNPLKYIMGTGIREKYWSEFQERFNIEKIIEVYGTTEGVGALINFKGVPGMIGRLNAAFMRIGEVARYDMEKNVLIRNDKGFVEKCRPGEKGMFLAKLSKVSTFSGYKNNEKATNEKIITNVFKRGDKYFISGDIFQLHKKGYVSFVDRVGDIFRWKSELVCTNEVADILNKYDCFEDCNVFGVCVKNTEGRAGMAALTLLQGAKLDWPSFATYVIENLPDYAWPYFIRILKEKETNSTFKQVKTRLQEEGFDPSIVKDPLYFLDPIEKHYVILTAEIYANIQGGKVKF